jgi:glucose-1-phosphate adenylyltransferase
MIGIKARLMLSIRTCTSCKGTADAVYQNLYFLDDAKADEILILSADHIYIMRYDRMIATHRSRGADITLAVKAVPEQETSRFGVVTLDHNERIINFEEKPKAAKSKYASMGVYIFNKGILAEALDRDAKNDHSNHDFGQDILPDIISRYKVYGFRHRGYWRDVGTVQAYWQANMDLIADLPELNLYNPQTEILTAEQHLPPAKFGPKAKISRCLIADGAIINGKVENSVISPRVFIEEDALVKDSVIFNDTTVGKSTMVDKAIIDKQAWIESGCNIGFGDDFTMNKEEPDYLNTGITVIGKGAKILKNTKIGRNCKINCWVDSNDFATDIIPSGASISKKIPRRHIL